MLSKTIYKTRARRSFLKTSTTFALSLRGALIFEKEHHARVFPGGGLTGKWANAGTLCSFLKTNATLAFPPGRAQLGKSGCLSGPVKSASVALMGIGCWKGFKMSTTLAFFHGAP